MLLFNHTWYLYHSYRAGLTTWAQLPLTTQCNVLRASAAASHVAYVATLATPVRAWCVGTTLRTGGRLTGVLPVVQANTVATAARTAVYRKVA